MLGYVDHTESPHRWRLDVAERALVVNDHDQAVAMASEVLRPFTTAEAVVRTSDDANAVIRAAQVLAQAHADAGDYAAATAVVPPLLRSDGPLAGTAYFVSTGVAALVLTHGRIVRTAEPPLSPEARAAAHAVTRDYLEELLSHLTDAPARSRSGEEMSRDDEESASNGRASLVAAAKCVVSVYVTQDLPVEAARAFVDEHLGLLIGALGHAAPADIRRALAKREETDRRAPKKSVTIVSPPRGVQGSAAGGGRVISSPTADARAALASRGDAAAVDGGGGVVARLLAAVRDNLAWRTALIAGLAALVALLVVLLRRRAVVAAPPKRKLVL